MNESFDIKACISRLEEAFGPLAGVTPDLKWKLLEKLSTNFLPLLKNADCDISSDYSRVLTVLIDALKPTLFQNAYQEELFSGFFLNGIHHYSFIFLVQRLSSSNPSFQQQKILNLIERFLLDGSVYHMFLHQCFRDDSEQLKHIAGSAFWDSLITMLVSLPERVANRASQAKKIFSPSSYVPFLLSNMWKTLCTVNKNLTLGKSCNIEFLGKVAGRLCFAGHSGTVAKYLCAHFIKVSATDFIWRRIASNFICKVPSTSLEMFLSHALLEIPWYGYVEWILGDVVASNKKIQYLLTVKFLFIHQFKNDLLLRNVIGYLASSERRENFFHKVFKALLDAWSDDSVFKHQSFTQHYYLASSIMICISHLRIMKNNYNCKYLLQKALNGIQLRLGNSEALVRNIGMFVGECLVTALDSEAPKLEFEHDLEKPEMKHLQDLLCIQKEPERNFSEENLLEIVTNPQIENDFEDADIQHLNDTNCSFNSKQSADNLDSDDDLKPYDMSDDAPKSKSRPHYIRDCLQGLIEAENPEWTEQCLLSAPDLIQANPCDASEVAVEMAKVLLHLDDTFAMQDFVPARHRALMVITVHCPFEVAPYLTSQFYEKDYNIRQRLDILEVIAAASQALSQPKFRVPACEEQSVSSSKVPEKKWQQIIEKRLETKTKHISLVPRKKVPEPQMNMFGCVAGYFFFPLLEKFDRKSKMLNLMGDDSYVLGCLLYTLGIVMHSASGTPVCRQMGSSLLKFLSVTRNHAETFVRKAAIFATTMVFLSVPPFLLLCELQDDVSSSQLWLNDIVENDYDAECQVRAAQALQLIVKYIKEGLPSLSKIL